MCTRTCTTLKLTHSPKASSPSCHHRQRTTHKRNRRPNLLHPVRSNHARLPARLVRAPPLASKLGCLGSNAPWPWPRLSRRYSARPCATHVVLLSNSLPLLMPTTRTSSTATLRYVVMSAPCLVSSSVGFRWRLNDGCWLCNLVWWWLVSQSPSSYLDGHTRLECHFYRSPHCTPPCSSEHVPSLRRREHASGLHLWTIRCASLQLHPHSAMARLR